MIAVSSGTDAHQMLRIPASQDRRCTLACMHAFKSAYDRRELVPPINCREGREPHVAPTAFVEFASPLLSQEEVWISKFERSLADHCGAAVKLQILPDALACVLACIATSRCGAAVKLPFHHLCMHAAMRQHHACAARTSTLGSRNT